MKNNNRIDIKKLFGEKLLAYRKRTGLSQEEYGQYIGGIAYTQIKNIEKGKHSVGLETVGDIAFSFGVEAHEMLNPKFPVPTLDKMPKALRDYIKETKKKRLERKDQPRQKLAHHVDEVLASDFLETARTAKEIADHIKGSIVTTPGKITTLLTATNRKKFVKTIPGSEWGGSVNKYVLNEFWKGE